MDRIEDILIIVRPPATLFCSHSSEMGMLSIYFKPQFLGLLKFMNSMNWFIVFFSLINLSVCIYEDQIGKFDWRQSYVGRIKFSQFDTVSTAKKIIVATEENVLAALKLKTGEVVWRHVLESATTGNIQLLHMSDKTVVTVSGCNPYLVRGWDSNTGVLIWEWSLTLQDNDKADLSEWWVQNNMLVHMIPVYGSHIEVTMYNLVSGHNRGATSKLPTVWTNDGCVLTPPYYTCVSNSPGDRLLLSMDVTSNAVQIVSKSLDDIMEKPAKGTLRPLDANSEIPGVIIDDEKVVLINENMFKPLSIRMNEQASTTVVDNAGEKIIVQLWSDDIEGLSITAHNIATEEQVSEIHCSERGVRLPEPEMSSVMCARAARDQLACRLLVTAADDAAHLLQQTGRIVWTREEALANVVAAEFVDLPVSDLDAAIESEFDQKEGSIWAAFTRRLHMQFQQLQTLIQNLQSAESSTENGPEPLVRDYFNLHKIIVLVTEAGKIFGMDNLSGEILWERYERNLDTENVLMFTRRSARHPPHDAYLSIVGKHVDTGNGLIISLNPIRGVLVGEKVLELDSQIMQCALLHNTDEEKLHALILLDKDENVQVFPLSSAHVVENMYMYVVHRETGKVQGYAIKYNGKEVVSQQTWSLEAGGRVYAVAASDGAVRGGAGRVLGDRSVLYKHGGARALLAARSDSDDSVIVTVVDTVTGSVLTSQAHRRSRPTSLAVHADNFFAYVYYNDKHRRTEIGSIELYTGAARWCDSGACSAWWAGPRPAAPRAAYVLPAGPRAAAPTATARGLTDTHLLVALSTGAIVELPWAYLDPRRPITPTMEEREEGLIPYAPELPLPSEAVINYNLTLVRIKAIYTAPSGLESTSLVLATGLDLFYTRVAPSKTFDLLKDDFDYYLITIVLAALIVASYSTKYFASRKMLKMAWK